MKQQEFIQLLHDVASKKMTLEQAIEKVQQTKRNRLPWILWTEKVLNEKNIYAVMDNKIFSLPLFINENGKQKELRLYYRTIKPKLEEPKEEQKKK